MQESRLTELVEPILAEHGLELDGLDITPVGKRKLLRITVDGDGRIVRDIVTVPLDGSAANDGSRVRSVVGGSDFLAYPRVSPDRQRVAWIAWNHRSSVVRMAAVSAGSRAGAPDSESGNPFRNRRARSGAAKNAIPHSPSR